MADVTGAGVDFKSLQVGVTPATPNGAPIRASVSHRGPSARNDAEPDPKKLFTKLFMDGGTTPNPTPGTPAPTRWRSSTPSGRACSTRAWPTVKRCGKLGTADKRRVEEHLEAIRRIELRLRSTPSGGTGGMGGTTKPAACASPVAPTTAADGRSEAPPGVNTAMAELSTLALACERTRVLTYMFSLPAAHVYYRHLDTDMNADFHDTILSWRPRGISRINRAVDKGVMYAMRCLNEFLTNFKNTTYGGPRCWMLP